MIFWKFDSKSDEVAFVGYSSISKAYGVFNKRTLCVEESVYVVCDESGKLKVSIGGKDSDVEKLIPI